jgi:hypothetical protein
VAAKKPGPKGPRKASLAAAIAETRKDPLRGHNALIQALHDGGFEQPQGAINVWNSWRTAYIKAYVAAGGTYKDALRDSYGKEKRQGPKDRFARAEAGQAVADEYKIQVRRVQQILKEVLRGDQLLKPYHRQLFAAQAQFNATVDLATKAEALMREPAYADLRGSNNALAAAFIRAHEMLRREFDENYSRRLPPAKQK